MADIFISYAKADRAPGIYAICCLVFFGTAIAASLNHVAPAYMLALLAAFAVVPLAPIIWVSQQRLQCLALATLLMLFWITLAVVPLFSVARGTSAAETTTLGWAGVFSAMLVPIGVIAIELLTAIKSINQRLLFLATGVLLLVALNMISRLGLDHFLVATSPPV